MFTQIPVNLNMRLKRYCFVFFMLWGLISQLNGQSLDQVFREFKNNHGLKNAAIGFCLMDAKKGTVLFSYHDSETLVPASCLKIPTTAAGLGLLGRDHKYVTSITCDFISASHDTVKGDLTCIGGGDPTFGSSHVNDQQISDIVAKIAKAGIVRITGKLVIDDSYFDTMHICTHWAWDDIGNYFGAGVFSLNYGENDYRIMVQPGKKPGDTVRYLNVFPKVGLTFENRLRTGAVNSGDQSNVFGLCEDDCRVLAGTIPPGNGPFSIKGSVPNPPAQFAKELAVKLYQRKILKDSNNWTVASHPTATHHNLLSIDSVVSPALSDIVHTTNLESNNLYAEAILKEIGKKYTGKGSREAGRAVVKAYWKNAGLDTTGIYMEDGCGLSRNDRISAFQLAKMLSIIQGKPYYDDFLQSLPVSGYSGAMKHICAGKDTKGKIHCKTGHMDKVRAYSGYVQTQSGKWLCFSLIVNDYDMSAAEIRQEIEKVLEALVKA